MNIIQEAKEKIELLNRAIERATGGQKEEGVALMDLISRLVDRLEWSTWELIRTKDCGCEIRKSNKEHYFADSCENCTDLPPELYIHATLPPVGDKNE